MKKILVIFVLIAVSVSITTVYAQNQYQIPAWVKEVAGFWVDGKITNSEFGEGLSFLINNNMIKVPQLENLKNQVTQLESKVEQLELENARLRNQNNEGIDATEPLKSDLNLQTDQVLYGQGDVVVITGLIHNIENLSNGTKDVVIIVLTPDNNIVTTVQVRPNADGSFQTSLKADGPQFNASGDYTIQAKFSGLTSEITFEFTNLIN